MKLSELRSLLVEAEKDKDSKNSDPKSGGNIGSEKDEGTPAEVAIRNAGGVGEIKKKTGISAPMMSHLRKPSGHKDNRIPSGQTLANLKAAGVDINKLLPKAKR